MGYFMKNKNKITGIALLGVFASFALLGTIFALGRVINKVSTINFDIASIVLSSLTILLMIFNLIYSDIRQNKIKKMTNQDKLDYSLKMKKWVKDNILLLRNKRIKEYKLAISYGIFNYSLLFVSFFITSIALRFGEKNLPIIFFMFLLPIILPATLIWTISKFNNVLNKEKKDKKFVDGELFKVSKGFVKDIFKEENIDKEVNVGIIFDANCRIDKVGNDLSINIGYLLLKFLSLDELKAILYHEIAHYRNKDLEYTEKICKLQNKFNSVLSLYSYKLLCPFALDFELKNELGEFLATEYYENKADDEVLNKNVSKDFVNACGKIFGLSRVNTLNYPEVDSMTEERQKWDEESISLSLKLRYDLYNKQKKYYELVSKKHASERFTTHPNIRERREKFNVDVIDFNITENHYFDEDIKQYFDITNKYAFERSYKDAFERYKKYNETKNDIDINDLSIVTEYAKTAFEYEVYDDAKKFARRSLEIDPSLSRMNYILGWTLIMIDCDEEGVTYLKKVIDENKGDEFSLSAMQTLGDYYVETGNEEGIENIRNIQVGVYDKGEEYKEVTTLKLSDTLTKCENKEVIDNVVDIAKNSSDIKGIYAGIKTINQFKCTHFVVIIDGIIEDQEGFSKTINSIISYFNSIEGHYCINAIPKIQLSAAHKLLRKDLIVYKK